MENLGKLKISEVEETDIGVYIWKMPDGRWVGDDEGNFLSISSRKGNLRMVQTLTETVRSYGIEEGSAVFLSGRRKITDAEYDEQTDRLLSGKIPDEYDIPALIEEMNQRDQSR